jgi:Beta-propeller repeat
MQTKSKIARIAGLLAIAVILPLAILIGMIHSGKKPLAQASKAASTSAVAVTPANAQKVAAEYGKLPMSFEPNQGQSASQVKFVSRGQGYQLFLTGDEAVMAVRSAPKAKKVSPRLAHRMAARETSQFAVVSMKLNGANENAAVTGASQLPGKVNYFIGKDASKWHTDVPTYAQVKYAGIYPGIDLIYYGNQKQLEYDFVVAPGADPKAIAFNVNGASTLRVSKQGDLVMKTAAGDVKFAKPVVYQEIAGERRDVAGKFVLKGEHEVKFALGAYDATQALTIDPSVLIYSTYLGGSGANGDFGYGIALDTAGDAFVVGTTSSADFPAHNSYGTPANIGAGVTAAFVTELNPGGTAFTYSTYLGGSGTDGNGDGGDAIAVDGSGHVFVSGYTESSDFPTTTNAYNQNNNPPESISESGAGFVAELNPATSGTGQLLYSTYIGGSGTIDEAHSVATNGSGIVYATGVSDSPDFPTVNPLQPTPNGSGNAYLAEIDTTKSGVPSLIFSTVLGGTGTPDTEVPYSSVGLGIKVDTAGHSYVAGSTTSADFAPAPASGTTCGTGGQGTAFLVEVDTSVATPTSLFALCLGGNTGDTVATSVAIAPDATAGITGQTFASNFTPITNTIPLPAGVPSTAASVVFAAKINTTGGTAVAYSTLFGGNTGDNGYGIAFDSSGNIYIGGETQSGDFPITPGALQTANTNPNGTGFIAKLNPAGGGASDILYATYFGGAGGNAGSGLPDAVNGIAVSGTNAYVVGQTASANSGSTPFPITDGAPQNVLPAASIANAFIAEAPLIPTIGVSPVSLSFGTVLIGTTAPAQYVTIVNNTSSAVALTFPPAITGANAADFANSATAGPAGPACTASIAAGTTCTLGVTFTPTVNGAESATLTVVTPLETTAVALSGTGSNTSAALTPSPTTLTFTGTLIGDTSAAQTVTFTNNTGGAFSVGTATASAGFGIGSDTCSGANLAVAATCTIGVTLAPPAGTAVGAITGSLSVPGSSEGSSAASVTLNGTVWDFSLTVPATATVPKNGSNTFPAAINGLGGFPGTVNVTCATGNSAVATCSVSPTSGTSGQSVTVTVLNGSGSAGMVLPITTPSMPTKQVVFAGIALMLLCLVPMTRQRRTQLGLVAAMLVFTVVAGCSGSTHPKSTTLTIAGTSGDITHSYTVNVTRN